MQNKKNIIILTMCLAVVAMSIGYAIFQTNLNIGASGNINTLWKIGITNITSSITGSAQNISEPVFTGITATFDAELKKPGDKINYTISLTNGGNIDAVISDVIINTSGASEIIYSISGLEKNQKLPKNSTIDFELVTEFDINATSIPVISNKKIDLSIIVVQES